MTTLLNDASADCDTCADIIDETVIFILKLGREVKLYTAVFEVVCEISGVGEISAVSVVVKDVDADAVTSTDRVIDFIGDVDSILDFDEEILDNDEDDTEGLFVDKKVDSEERKELADPVATAGDIDCCELEVSDNVDAAVVDEVAVIIDNNVGKAVLDELTLLDAEREGSFEKEGDAEDELVANAVIDPVNRGDEVLDTIEEYEKIIVMLIDEVDEESILTVASFTVADKQDVTLLLSEPKDDCVAIIAVEEEICAEIDTLGLEETLTEFVVQGVSFEDRVNCADVE